MQPRRMKRLAGPAYYVNVKFNQSLASSHKRNKEKRHHKYNNFHEWELFDIKEGEIVVCQSKHRSSRDHFPRVISSLNGALRATENEDDLLQDYTFFGIAQTEHVAVKEPKINQGLVAGVGGLATIINDYDENLISPGDLLYLAPPSSAVPHRGIPKDKKRFCLKPDPNYNPNQSLYDELEALALGIKFGNITEEEFINEFVNELKKRKRPVAKALSHAKKGERLDILLHPRLPTFINV